MFGHGSPVKFLDVIQIRTADPFQIHFGSGLHSASDLAKL